MANEDNKVKLLELDLEDIQFFSETDIILRSGRHIQNIEEQANAYDFIYKYYDQLKTYYKLLFDVDLVRQKEEPDRYYYLDINEDSKSLLKQNSKKLKQEYHLFGILLLKIIRVDKYFSNKIGVRELHKIINDNIEYKTKINKLFANSDKPTEIGEKTIETWIKNSLSEFEKLNWIKFQKNNPNFFIPLPSIDRLLTLYNYQIQNIDKLFEETNKLENDDE